MAAAASARDGSAVRDGLCAGAGGAQLPSDVSLAYASVMKAPVYKATPFEPRWTVWGTAFGGYNRTDGDPIVRK